MPPLHTPRSRLRVSLRFPVTLLSSPHHNRLDTLINIRQSYMTMLVPYVHSRYTACQCTRWPGMGTGHAVSDMLQSSRVSVCSLTPRFSLSRKSCQEKLNLLVRAIPGTLCPLQRCSNWISALLSPSIPTFTSPNCGLYPSQRAQLRRPIE